MENRQLAATNEFVVIQLPQDEKYKYKENPVG
jgi:hypothetical protein